ncbi:MAG: alpha/beta hydrolase [Clostridiales bacterium]|nr:alpha/beta hydrolase [Clostridiales bacterium]
MLQKQVFQWNHATYDKHVTIYQDDQAASKACILYFHGGGLLYGNREDLPDRHLSEITRAGYPIIAFDYPLAPAAKLDIILEDVCASVNDYLQNVENYNGISLPYFLWGRSSGAYLCLLAAASNKLLRKPLAVLSYYGYGFLCDNWYQVPSRYYCKLPAVKESCLQATPQQMHAGGDLETHYSVYVYARQTGNWKNLIYDGREKFFLLNYSLRTCDRFPCPLFCAHATGDTDVPYTEFLELCNRFHAKRFIAATNLHDFDRDEDSHFTKRLLEATLTFMEEKLPANARYVGSREN